MLALTPEEVVARLTLEEKASLTSGSSFWFTQGVARAGIPEVMLTDGPHGVRKQRGGADHVGLADSEPATCFPPAVALGSTFDPDLLARVGAALGEEAAAQGVGVLLGPGINIKRSPLCGRNFEYLSEDPVVSGVLGAALVRGLQSQGVGASLKHFAANNQEADRMRVSADVDERPLREIYLRGFQRVVTEAGPWTLMCSYNKINGTYASQNRWLLTDVLRDEWGFRGLVMSDWGAVDDRVAGVAAGLDLEMPSSEGRTDAEIVAAVRAGSLDEAVLDVAAARVVDLVQKTLRRDGHASSGSAHEVADGYDVDAHHALAREVAARSVVLLENDGILPLAPSTRVAAIGAFAAQPRYQGAGSSLINPTRLDTALDGLREHAAEGAVTYAAGFLLGEAHSSSPTADELVREAVAVAAASEVAVVFLGLPAELESEGYDRADIELPVEQLALLDAVADANPRVVVVLSNGGVVRVGDVTKRSAAVVEAWLLGQAGGTAVADVLYGAVNPSGRLAETIPHRLQDSPAYLDFPGEHGHVRYGEGLFVGYRWYDARDVDIAHPFGHGLSYTTFEYSELSVTPDAEGLEVSVTVTNTGERDGREVVQVYTGLASSEVARPRRELKAFASVALAAGESRVVELRVGRADLACWDIRSGAWVVEGGSYAVEVGASSRDIRVGVTVPVAGDEVAVPLTLDSSLDEVMADPEAAELVRHGLSRFLEDPDMVKLIGSAPVGRILGFPGTGVVPAEIGARLERLNAERGLRRARAETQAALGLVPLTTG
ncbi:MAG TPA: glycoside hydrolase family 3 C-terminal domain-containing protein [Humibacillus xanthopallidus]|nr:glycoside hydrolase family 3 C-terminal domain-containing protein [Humibacillus xanthopallidus]